MAQISVDRDFARFGSKSYAINKINTVEVREVKGSGLGWSIFLGICAGIAALFGVAILQQPDVTSFPLWVIAAVFAFASYGMWSKSIKREYHLFLRTSSSETQAFSSSSEEEVMQLRDQIEAAMVGHI